MWNFLTKNWIPIASILGETVWRGFERLLTNFNENTSDEAVKQKFSQALESQLTASAVFKKRGLSGVASAYDAGWISEADFMLYIVMSQSFRISGISLDQMQEIEEQSSPSGFLASIVGATSDPGMVTSDIDTTLKVFAYLKSKTSFQ